MTEVITCMADREIRLIQSSIGLYDQYLAVMSVEGVGKNPAVFVGKSDSVTRDKIGNCSRCVVPFHRKCDLSSETISNLEPQN